MEEILKISSVDGCNTALKTADDFILEEPEQKNFRNAGREKVGGMLPGEGSLAELLGMDDTSPIDDILRSALFEPLGELASGPGKRIRGQLVMLSFRLVTDTPPSVLETEQCRRCAEVIELIHAGSLIIDDIEDGSSIRRGRPALHMQAGLPLALNAGNWLYFWGLELLRTTELPEEKIFLLYEHCHRTLLRAHFGQAVDLSARIPRLSQCRIATACLASIKLKTGALMGFATFLGGTIAGASERLLSILDEFGRELGVALQMFNDLGNVIGKCDLSKRYEDLKLYRPSWVWACAAESSTVRDYKQFCAAVGRLPDVDELEMWIDENELVHRVRASAHHHLDAAFLRLEERLNQHGVHWSKCALDQLRQLGNEITLAYG
jgi:geranylgeranyl pyrophosphate synthase